MPFEPGNQLSAKPRVVDALIRSCLAQDNDNASKRNERSRLRQAIETVLDQAAAGSLPHLDWLTTRIEGKAAASLTVSGDEDRPLVSMIKMIVVSANSNEINELRTIEGEKKTVIEDNSLTYPPLPLPPKVNFSDGGGV